MSPRLVVALTTVALLGAGSLAPALAAESKARHNVCIKLPGNNPTDPRAGGFCIGWEDPLAPQQ